MTVFDDLLKDLDPWGNTGGDPASVEREKTLADLSQYEHALHHVDFGNDDYDAFDEDPVQNEAAQRARNLHVSLLGGANCFSSALVGTDDLSGRVEYTGQHTIALDLDFPVQVIEGGGKTMISLDFVQAGIEVDDLGFDVLVRALYFLPIGGGFSLTPRGLAFETPHHARWVPSSTPGHGHLYIDAILWWDEYEALLEAFAWAGLVEPGYVGASKRRRATHLRLPWVKKDSQAGESEVGFVTGREAF